MRRIILASASPRRRELLERAGINFEIIPSKDEEKVSAIYPSEVVKELSYQKAVSVSKTIKDPSEEIIIIGSDTLVAYGEEILGKPVDENQAFHTLKHLQGNTHQVYTGVTVLINNSGKWKEYTFCECTDVTFFDVTDEEILEYIQTGDCMDKAGSYGIQGPWGIYVKGIKGDYNNVVGLPVSRLIYEMKKIGISLRGK